LQALHDYHWPGNIRELRNVIERAVALCPGPKVTVSDLPEPVRSAAQSTSSAAAPSSPGPIRRGSTLAECNVAAEIVRIVEALAKHNNNRVRAANELGISRMGLYKKLHRYGLFEVTASRM
jgi:DNA-binding NtrC family response regulator